MGRLVLLITLYLLCSDAHVEAIDECPITIPQTESGTCDPSECPTVILNNETVTCNPNGCLGNTPIFNAQNGTCHPIPHQNDFTIITDSTSYNITLPVNELSDPPVVFQEFTVYFSPQVFISAINLFVLLIEESGGHLGLFSLQQIDILFAPSDNIENIQNALLFSGEENELEIGTYYITLNVNTPTDPSTPTYTIADFTVNIVEVPDPCLSNPCANGNCSQSGEPYSCECYPGYTGMHCDIELDPCDTSPCKNNGSCTKITPTEFSCQCTAGYTGSICSANINDCEGVICINGNCVDELNGYHCHCDAGFEEDDSGNCTININDCMSDPCVNGLCEDEINGFTCSCYLDYTGAECGQQIDDCDPNPCDSHGYNSYMDGNQTCHCECRSGFTGELCSININDCDPNFCQNNATCVDGITSYTCSCAYGYTDSHCETPINFCEGDPCNHGSCTSVEAVGFMCECDPGYTGNNCSQDIDDCASNPCGIGVDTCVDEINGFHCMCLPDFTGDLCDENITSCDTSPCKNNATCNNSDDGFMCECPPDYNGTTCEQKIDDCASNPCVNGDCIDGIEDFTCECEAGFTGNLCESDIDSCEFDNPCLNGGTCINLERLGYNCSCADGYFGINCTGDVSVCTDSTPCQNGGTCTDGPGLNYTCQCPDGFNGDECENDVDICDSNPCKNDGTCTDDYGLAFNCTCIEGFEGDICDMDINACLSDPCQNGGTCLDLPGPGLNFNCSCEPGFGGFDCSVDEMFCNDSYCQNGGTCVDGLGTAISCSCSIDYTGTKCETELTFCTSNVCMNGGTCMEDAGNETYCLCVEGFGGDFCETDKDYCNSTTCLNGGTCMEGHGTVTSCMCSSGFNGDSCQNDLNFCTDNTCSNGGTCLEGYGNITNCECPDIYTGDYCQTPFCPEGYCNNGTCIDTTDPVTCECFPGYKGGQCQDDIDFCTTLPCMNGGTCVDGPSLLRTCYCPPTFSGDDCEIPVCQDDSCENGGTCSIVGDELICFCPSGFNGSFCENDQDFCNSTVCLNGGTCEEGYGDEYSCECSDGFGGDYCQDDLDFCMVDTCINGGTCKEGYGPITTCDCLNIYTGDHCQTPFCPENYCNNGTCNATTNPISCNCFPGYLGDNCKTDIDYCLVVPCQNGGTCSDGHNTSRTCYCPPTFTGASCETPVCQQDSCENGGTCVVQGNTLVCICPLEFTGPTCEIELINVCDSNPCQNGGTCNVGQGTTFSCACPANFTGPTCEIPLCTEDSCSSGGVCDVQGNEVVCICFPNYTGATCSVYLPCFPNQCSNGGTCIVNNTESTFSCECAEGYFGNLCQFAASGMCKEDSECATGLFCSITCASDDYPPHSALLSEAIDLQGISYVNVEASKHPNFSGDITVFLVFQQDPGNQGYLLFYGTSGNDRNFAIFLDNDTELTFYYLAKDGVRMSTKLDTNWNQFERHSLTISIDISEKYALFYLDDAGAIVRILENPDLTALISDTKPASLLVGARLPHHYRFSGQIEQVVFFTSTVLPTFPSTLRSEFDSLVAPTGQCTAYLQNGDGCPTPTTAPSPLCVSATSKCDPTLKCLIPFPGSSYSCQPMPASCTTDDDCSSGYFCGSELPSGGSQYFQNPEFSLPGKNHFLLEPSMQFNGEQIVSLSADYQPRISSELTIFAVVTQEPDNDGYVVGKGLNDRMRDFGLYLRSSQNTVWLAYGADEEGEGFREILFFYDVNIADGNVHTIGAVVSGVANRAVLYIDGKAVGQQSPLPSMPTFRPGYNLLYVGGRPGTKRFRFKGTISNLLVSTAPLQADSIAILHTDAMEGSGKLNLQPPTSRFCRKYISTGSQCELVNGDIINNFRCAAPAECVPIQDSSLTRVLPDVNSLYAVLGRCITPCDCSDQPESFVCGSDGNTYANSCYRDCAQVTEVHAGACDLAN